MQHLVPMIQKAGITHVEQRTISVPLGTWGSVTGCAMSMSLETYMSSLKLRIMTALHVSSHEFDRVLRALTEEWETYNTTYQFYAVYGQRPYAHLMANTTAIAKRCVVAGDIGSYFFRAMQLVEKIQSPLIRKHVFLGYIQNVSVTEFIQKIKEIPDILFFSDTFAENTSTTSKAGELLGKAAVPGQADRVVECYLDMAESLFMSDDDPGHAYIRENSVTRATHRARFFVTRGMPSKAVELLTGIYNRDATPDNVEVLSLLAQAYSHMVLRREEDSFERVCFFVEALVDVSRRMESQLHHSQAQISYEFLMLSKWHREFSERLSHVVAF